MEHVLYIYDGVLTILKPILFIALIIVALGFFCLFCDFISNNIHRRIVWIPVALISFLLVILFCWYVGAVEQGYFS